MQTELPPVPNWVDAEGNPHNLQKPPDWFLRMLADYDPDLVIFPSQQQPCFRLARRVKSCPPLQTMAQIDKSPDTQTYAKYNALPVTSIVPFIQWTPEFIEYLRSRDIWAVGGGEKAAAVLEHRDLVEQSKLENAYEDERDMLSGSAYRAAKQRLGETVFVQTDKSPS